MDTESSGPPLKKVKLEEPVEGIDPLDLESTIISLLTGAPDGISNGDLQSKTPNIDPVQRGIAVNRLLSTGRVEMRKLVSGGEGDFVLKLKNQKTEEKHRGSNQEETLVYEIIEEAGNKGVWVRDIRIKSGLAQAQLNKVLRDLEHRKLVKSVKAMNNDRKKVYMLFELEPDDALTGGSFYSDQDFDVQFVDLLHQQCNKFLRSRAELARQKYGQNLAMRKKASSASSEEICKHINALKISRIELSNRDIEKICDTLVWDSLAEKKPDNPHSCYTASTHPLAPRSWLESSPCTFCPVSADCSVDGPICPAKCQYFDEWTSF